MLAVERCSLQAEKFFAHLKEVAALIADGDAETHGRKYGEYDGAAKVRAHSDLGQADRLLYIDSMAALDKMAVDDADTVEILRTRLHRPALKGYCGQDLPEGHAPHRGLPLHVYQRHTSRCLFQRFDKGRENLLSVYQGQAVTAVECECE